MRDSKQASAEQQHNCPAARTDTPSMSTFASGFVDNRAAATAQRMLADAIDGSPFMVAQRRRIDDTFGSARQLRMGPGMAQLQQALPNKTGLPDNLKSGIESLSGISMEGVKVHYNSSQPAQLNALAFAQGSDIHLAPGQEQHLPHEAWHVVQQAQGRVKPTTQMKGGVPVNDDQGLEHEADVMGARALLQGDSGATQQGGVAQPLQRMDTPLQCRGTPLDLPRAQGIVDTQKNTILTAAVVQQASASFAELQQHWPARLLVEAMKPAVMTWQTLRTQLDTDCLAAPSTDGDTLGANIRNIIQLGKQLTAAAPPADAALQPARTALAAANNSPPLADLVLLLGDACGGVDQAAPQVVAIDQLLQAAAGGASALIARACPLALNSAAAAVNAALYLAVYTANPKADAVSEQVLGEAGLDISVAAQRMTALSTWGYDLALESWSESQSDTLAQEGVDKIKQDAQTEKLRLESELPADPGSKPVRGKKEKRGSYDNRVQEWSSATIGRTQGQAAILIEEDKITGADAKKPGLKKQRHDEMSGFMVSWTASLGVELAGWTLQLAGGRQPVAEALAALQTSAQLTGLDKREWASWAIGLSSAATGIAVLQRALELAIQAGCDPQLARVVAVYNLTASLPTPQLQKVASAVATSPAEIAEIIVFLRTKAPIGDALDALYRAVTVGHVPVKALAAFCDTHGVEMTAWALTHGAGNLKDSEKLLDLIGDKVSRDQLAKLLKKGSTDDLVFLLERVDFDKPNPTTLLKLYTKADSPQLRTLLARPDGFSAHILELWLVTRGYVAADIITLLGLTSATVIEGMVSNSSANPTAVLAAYQQLNAGNGDGIGVLKTLIQTYPGKNLPILVGAHLSKGSWDKGSFVGAMESIFYHHNTHGAGRSVEQYTQDAQTCWAGGGAFNWTDATGRTSKKIQGPPGGTFTPAGGIYSFWYV